MSVKYILCVDDEKFVLESLQRELERAFAGDFIVETAESGEEALDIVEEIIADDSELPVIIADYIMPGMKGDAMLIDAHKKLPDARKIMLTGQATAEGVANAVNYAALYRYIAKPWDARDLKMTVEEAIKSFDKDKRLRIQREEILKKNEEIIRINKNLERLVAERTADLIKKQKEITDSINYARRIQLAVMGDQENIRKLLPESGALYLPKDVVSGDFFWFAEKSGKAIVAAGDCTGHGVPGAFMSMIGISLLNHIVNERGVACPGEILNLLRERTVAIMKQTGKYGEAKDGMDIAIVAVDSARSELEFAGAYNPLYYIPARPESYSPDVSPKIKRDFFPLIEIKADRAPIGISYKTGVDFETHKIALERGDLVYVFTDGFIDQFGGERGKKYLARRLKKRLLEISHLPLPKQIETLQHDFEKWRGGEEQVDDVLLIGFRFTSEQIHVAETIARYEGDLNETIVADIIDSAESRLARLDLDMTTRKRTLKVIVEMTQNAYYYVKSSRTKFHGARGKAEFVFDLTYKEGLIEVATANLILKKDLNALADKINLVNSLDKKELNALYKKRLYDGDASESNRAGLGLFLIALKTSDKIRFESAKINKNLYSIEIKGIVKEDRKTNHERNNY